MINKGIPMSVVSVTAAELVADVFVVMSWLHLRWSLFQNIPCESTYISPLQQQTFIGML